MLTDYRNPAPVAAEAPFNAHPDASPRRRHGWIDREAALAALWPFVATRMVFAAIGLAAPLLFVPRATRQIPTGSGWLRWDSQWFIGTAEHGYPWKLFPNMHYSSAAFFPLYPAFIRATTLLGFEPGAAATLVANVAYLGALYYLYRLVRLDCAAPVAVSVLWLLSLFPTALAFFVPYSESLYLLCAVLTFWQLRRRRWLAAGLWGALGALTRQSGLVLMLPYLVEWAAVYIRDRTGRAGQRGPVGAVLPGLLIPLAVAGHLAYLWHVTGSPWSLPRAQRAWHRQGAWPWDGIAATVRHWTWPDTTGQHVHYVLELGALAVFLLLLLVGARRLRASYTLYAAAVWLAALVSPAIADNYWLPTMSSSRFALSVFPSFIVLALVLRRPGAYQAWVSASAMLLGFASVYYVLGGWVA